MATESELEKRSQKAKQAKDSNQRCCCCCGCQRHRAKAMRQTRKNKEAKQIKQGKQKSRKKGDEKSKNGRSATLVVAYELEEGPDGLLHGPKDKRVWADFGPRVNMMQWALQEARRRGVDPQSKDIHLVMDGEKCLREGMRQRFPNASIALDIRHAEEHLHDLGKLIYPGSKPKQKAQRNTFVDNYRAMLYEGKAEEMTGELRDLLDEANKQKKKAGGDPADGEYARIETEIAYFATRLEMMDYGELKKRDLVIASGQVEGAARHLIGDRMDCAGMRWKVERARVLMHLRCIEINGDWENFDAWLLDKTNQQLARGQPVKRTSTSPPPFSFEPDQTVDAA